MSAEAEVREASKGFYTALNRMLNGDAGPMAEVWSQGSTAVTMHPIGGREVGWDAVRDSFAGVAGLGGGGNVELKDQLIRVAGDVAYEAGVEKGDVTLGGEQLSVEHRVTNIYERENGAWKVVHHHTDTSVGMMELLARLQTTAQAGAE